MKRFMFAIIGMISISMLGSGCGQMIEPGHVGVKVNKVGSERGVDPNPISPGWTWYNHFTTEVHTLPSTVKQYVWTANKEEQSQTNESFDLNSRQSSTVNIDVGAGIIINPAQAPHIFDKYRMDIHELIAGPVRTLVREALMSEASQMDVMDIMGPGLSGMLERSKARLNDGELGQDGIHIDYLVCVNKPRPSPEVEASINAVIQASQRAQEQQNKIMEAAAIARQKIETARGDSASAVIAAMGQAEANRLLNASLSNAVIEYTKINRWDGQVPQVVTGGGTSTLVSVK